MFKPVVFDIETYNPHWRIRLTRREGFDPAKNTITTTGFFDGKEMYISPIVYNMKEDREPVQFFLRKLRDFEGSILVGYNILRFDIPYLVYKSKAIGKTLDLARFKPLDLYWILPYWLHNIPSGKAFSKRVPSLGSLWRFSYVVEYILREKPNPVSNRDIHRLWEEERYDSIRRHLEY